MRPTTNLERGAKMSVNLDDRPQLISGLYTMDVTGNTLFYNPDGYGGVTVVDGEVSGLLRLFDGNRTVNEVAKLISKDSDELLSDVRVLAEREVLFISRRFTAENCRPKSVPQLSGWIHLTNRCNLACDYCYIHKTPGEMSTEVAILAVDKLLASCDLFGYPNLNLKFSGGEALMRFNSLKRIVDYAERAKGDVRVSYTLLTNAVLVTPEKAAYFAERGFGVGVSLDGPQKVHDLSRRTKSGKGSFDAVMRGIETLRMAGVDPSVNATITKENYTQLSVLTELALEEGWRFRFSPVRDTENGKPSILNEESGVIAELMACYDVIERCLPERDITQIHQFGDVVFNRPLSSACGAGNCFVAIGHDGKLGVCGLGLASPKGNMSDKGDLLQNVKENNAAFLVGKARGSKECGACFWRHSCAGACPLQTLSTFGSLSEKSPYCEIYKSVLPRILRIKGLQLIRDYQKQNAR